jgi:UDP-N-acetylmuramoyl-tripeptide--D-alanyl-D-alanine ligase
MMPALDLAAVASVVDAPYTGPALPLHHLCIDSRRCLPGDLFVALRGERVDGHRFVEDAARAGAAAALVEEGVEASLPCLRVADSVAALAAVGAANRRAYEGELLAITGSCGKTSVKNLCAAIFSGCAATVATAGNYNNELGVPLTLSRLEAETRYAVIEMGAAGRGHIAHLCDLARPRVSTVLNAMEAHLSGFGSVADVADIKAEIYDGLDNGGVGVVNLDQPWAAQWQERVRAAGATVLTCSLDGEAEVCAREVQLRGLAPTRFTLCAAGEQVLAELPLPGRHNLANALAAAALAVACGLPLGAIAEGIARVAAEPGRLAPVTLADGTVVIDDSYNANPGSVRAAIELLAATPGHRALVLGEMLELGADSARYHHEMGELAAARGIDDFWGVGEALAPAVRAFGDRGQLFADRDAVRPALAALLQRSDTVLVKGSRGAAMEQLLVSLPENPGVHA